MNRSKRVAQRICWLIIIARVALFSPFEFGAGRAVAALTIVDQDGRVVPDAPPSAIRQIFDVSVGPNGNRVFTPNSLSIAVGDTVRWTWASNNHSVTSGGSCTADLQYCSPNDTNCGAGNLSNTGTVYQHTFTQAGTYTYFCAAHCFQGMIGTITVAASCTPPPSGMAGWWPGDGNARDIQGGNNGALLNGTTFAAGKVGQAFSFDGVDDYVAVPHNNNLNPTGPFSVDVWVNANAQQTNNQSLIIDKSHGWTDSTGWAIQTNPDGTACFFYGTGGGGSGDFHGTCTQASILDAQWHHLAGVWTGTEIRIYEDGVLQNTLAFATAPANNTREVRLGSSWGGGTPTRFFRGLIDEAEYFNRALTQTEISAIFNAGAAGKCKPPQPLAASSRKTHGAAGTFDVNLMPSATRGIECRSGGVYQMIVQFPGPVTVAGATLFAGSGAVSGFSVSGAMATIDLNTIANAQTIVVKLTGVSDGATSGDVPVAMGVLIGDTNGSGAVSSSDIGQTKAQSGQAATAANFRTDVNASGVINASDIGQVKAQSGTMLP